MSDACGWRGWSRGREHLFPDAWVGRGGQTPAESGVGCYNTLRCQSPQMGTARGSEAGAS